jgi:MFS family permease
MLRTNAGLTANPEVNARNTWLLAVCQGLFTAALAIDLTLTGITGYQLAPDRSLATLPFALITVAGALATMYASLLMKRIGRRWGFVLGALFGATGGLISVWAIFHASFWMFCLGTAAVGVFQAFAQYYRLAAADCVEGPAKARVISTVLLGGVLAAVLGPALASWSKDLFSVLFAGSYLMVCALGLLSALLLTLGYRDVVLLAAAAGPAGLLTRSTLTILRQPISLAAIANNVVGGTVMMLVMTAAPLAAVACGHGIDDGANIIQWHLVGMYAPSLIAGRLIKRFGLTPILYTGMILSAACSVISMTSSSLGAFYAALFCLGVGWNFMFVGGTTLLAESYRPDERARVQGVAETIRYGATALASLLAGPALAHVGWAALNAAILPLVFLALLMTVVWVRQKDCTAPAAHAKI